MCLVAASFMTASPFISKEEIGPTSIPLRLITSKITRAFRPNVRIGSSALRSLFVSHGDSRPMSDWLRYADASRWNACVGAKPVADGSLLPRGGNTMCFVESRLARHLKDNSLRIAQGSIHPDQNNYSMEVFCPIASWCCCYEEGNIRDREG